MCEGFLCLAVWTRLELATPCVTGMYSNQTELPDRLHHDFKDLFFFLKFGCKSTTFFSISKEKNEFSYINNNYIYLYQNITQ